MVEFRKKEEELKKKKDEAYSLQIEVRELNDKITKLQESHTLKLQEIESEYNQKL